MNLRRLATRQFPLSLAICSLAASIPAASGQETLTTRDGKVHAVRIFGVESAGIEVQMDNARLTEPFGNVLAVTMDPPPEYQAALLAYKSGDLATALRAAKALVSKYRGLPVQWAESSMLMLGDVYVAGRQFDAAAAAYKDFQKAYPSAGGALVNVGLAQIDVAKKDYTAAKAKIDPLLAEALKQRNVPPLASATLGKAFYVSGQVKEASGDLPGALEDYLRTVTIFPTDRVAAVSAQERADALRKEHGTTVP